MTRRGPSAWWSSPSFAGGGAAPDGRRLARARDGVARGGARGKILARVIAIHVGPALFTSFRKVAPHSPTLSLLARALQRAVVMRTTALRGLPVVLGSLLLLGACSAAPDNGEGVAEDGEAISARCGHRAGAMPRDTLAHVPQSIPIKHVIVVTQENRSFDHMFGSLAFSRKDVDGIKDSYVNYDRHGNAVRFHHRTDTCFDIDPDHQEEAIESDVHDGKMDDFVKNAASATDDGHIVMSYYTGEELPFYYFLAGHYSIGDRYFSPMQGPTHQNRQFLYAATATAGTLKGKKTIFDEMDEHHVSWGVYSSGGPRQDCIGWDTCHHGFHGEGALFEAIEDDKLPEVAFVDPGIYEDEHPPHDVQGGEKLAKKLYDAVRNSKAWKDTVIFYTYDEAGGIADHVPPPAACAPESDLDHLGAYGVRVPMTVVSAYAKQGYVSHVVHSHTSVLRFIELIHDMPALTVRDANDVNAMLDMFDFAHPHGLPAAPAAGHGKCVKDPQGWLWHKEQDALHRLESLKCHLPFGL
jgi:phospholipase C